MTTPDPVRQRVTSPRRGRSRPATSWPVAREIDEQSRVGEVYMRALIRAQLRLALRVVAVLAVALGGLPLLFSARPGLRTTQVLGIPLPWLLLGAVVYPLLVAGGWLFVRAAERNEREFSDLVERS